MSNENKPRPDSRFKAIFGNVYDKKFDEPEVAAPQPVPPPEAPLTAEQRIAQSAAPLPTALQGRLDREQLLRSESPPPAEPWMKTREIEILLEESADLEQQGSHVDALEKVLEAAEKATVRSPLQDQAMAMIDPLLRKSSPMMGPLESGLVDKRISDLNQQRKAATQTQRPKAPGVR